jgi:trehalose-6-phosphate synthase
LQVLLVQIAVPSRTDVPEYVKLRSLVHEIVGRINGKYGTLTHVPIHHLDRSLAFIELCALYAITDVALVTSLRDGMNLVSYEYVACQSDNAGVLVLSEFAGAAQSLGAGALLINPWNVTDMSQAIKDALTMSVRSPPTTQTVYSLLVLVNDLFYPFLFLIVVQFAKSTAPALTIKLVAIAHSYLQSYCHNANSE